MASSRNTSTRLSYEDYTIGWVSALPLEYAAAKDMLDEEHQKPLNDGSVDEYTFTLGQIRGHHIALFCLPSGQYGNSSAAGVGSFVRAKFPRIRFGLLVGIGGGVPREDMRLGDVVISHPSPGCGGVKQYDFGKATPTGFVPTGMLNAPPSILLSAISEQRALHLQQNSHRHFHQYLSVSAQAFRQALPPDVLFQPDYKHDQQNPSSVCEKCNINMLVARKDQNGERPAIHYGTIASGNQVIRDGAIRDRLSTQLGGVLCFEMEAAGLMNLFPCLVIRGICDYSDSHKNKLWQNYAASTAAACAKELISMIPPAAALSQQRLAIGQVLIDNRPTLKALSKRPEWQLVHEDSYQMFDRISDYDPERVLNAHLRKRCPGTTSWIFEREEFQAWMGTIGSGKSITTSSVIEYLQPQQSGNDEALVAHFFFDRTSSLQINASNAFKSYIKQTLSHLETLGLPCPRQITERIKRFFSSKLYPASAEEIIHDIFLPISKILPKGFFVLDGLDECTFDDIQRIFSAFRLLIPQTESKLKIFISGRENLDVKKAFPTCEILRLTEAVNESDIRHFIDWKIEEKLRERQLTETLTVIEDIKRKLNQMADGMILWVHLQIEAIWESCSNDSEIHAALDDLPPDLDSTYARCLSRINKRQGRLSWRILDWVSTAKDPFQIDQLREALAIDTDSGRVDRDRLPSMEEVVSSCSNLISYEISGHVVLSHHSIRPFLDRKITSYKETNRWELMNGGLALGELCVLYLTSGKFDLSLQEVKTQVLKIQSSSLPEPSYVAKSAVPTWMRSFIPKARRPLEPKPKPLTTVRIRQNLPDTRTDSMDTFFSFARDQWAHLTHSIDHSWERFRNLALKPNLTWGLHPWPPLGQSMDSHYSGLLGWSIVHLHCPLIDALLSTQTPKPHPDIFKYPLPQYSAIPALHLAGRTGSLAIFQSLLPHCSIDSSDIRIRTAIHHAAETGAKDIMRYVINFVTNTVTLSSLLTRMSLDGTPLYLAAQAGHANIIETLASFYMYAEFEAGISMPVAELIAEARSGYDRSLLNLDLLLLQQAQKPNYTETPLFAAVVRGHLPAVEALIVAGADPQNPNSFGYAPFSAAVKKGHLHIVLQLLDRLGPEVEYSTFKAPISAISEKIYLKVQENADMINPSIKSLLLEATLEGHGDIIRALKNSRLGETEDFLEDIKQASELWIHIATERNQTDVVLALLEIGVLPDAPTGSVRSGLAPPPWSFFLSLKDTPKMVQTEQTRGGGGQPAADTETRLTPLHYAASLGEDSIIHILVDFGASLEARSQGGKTPLHSAIANQQWTAMKVLLERGANVNAYWGGSPLYKAASDGNVRLVETLIEFGADVNLTYQDLETSPLHIASRYGHSSVVRVLLEHGSHVNAINRNGRTPLFMAAMYNHARTVEILFDNGAIVDCEDQIATGTPLTVAVGERYIETVKALIRMGADVNRPGRMGQTPLYIAAYHGHLDSIEILVRAGGEPNAIGNSRSEEAAIHVACRNGNIEAVRLLVTCGADLNRQLFGLKSPLYAAASNGHSYLVKELVNLGAWVARADPDGSYLYKLVASYEKVVREDSLNSKGQAGPVPTTITYYFRNMIL